MRMIEYQKACLRTAGSKIDLVECALGICGELVEYELSGASSEEASDVIWYCTVALHLLGEVPEEPRSYIFTFREMACLAGEFAEAVKKHVYHGKDLDKDFCIWALNKTISSVFSSGVLELNIDKLKKRYPEKDRCYCIGFLTCEHCEDSEEPEERTDSVNRPKHYTSHASGIECIQITEHMSFCLGNALKYLWRADLKNGVEDLRKAEWYVRREIERREKE
jgi:hypothetical protein